MAEGSCRTCLNFPSHDFLRVPDKAWNITYSTGSSSFNTCAVQSIEVQNRYFTEHSLTLCWSCIGYKSVTAGVYRFTQSAFMWVCVAAYFSAPYRRQGEQQRASFRVVVWSLGVSSAPWQLTLLYGSKIWLFWRDGPVRKSKLCKCRPNSTLASNSPSSLCTHCKTGALLTKRAGWRTGISRGNTHTHTNTVRSGFDERG